MHITAKKVLLGQGPTSNRAESLEPVSRIPVFPRNEENTAGKLLLYLCPVPSRSLVKGFNLGADLQLQRLPGRKLRSRPRRVRRDISRRDFHLKRHMR